MTGVVGDDTTGSLDIGVMFHRAGCSVQLLIDPPTGRWPESDVTIIDTDSRLDEPGTAYEKARAATHRLIEAGCIRFHKKTCSVFRGNVGTEFDAMLDATGSPVAIISAAYPQMGRTTRHGRHFLHGKPLEESALAQDPIHPRTTSDLCTIIAEQSDRSCAIVPIEIVRAGATALRDRLLDLARHHAYLVVDGETQDDLAILAEASTSFRVFGGSAGFAGEWARFFEPRPLGHQGAPVPVPAGGGVLYISGSLTVQTRTQTAYLRDSGVAALELDPAVALEGNGAHQAWVQQCVEFAVQRLAVGESVLVTTVQDPVRIRSGQASAAARGMGPAVFGRKLSSLLADLSVAVLERATPAALVVAGGDTSGAISRRLRITNCRLLEELEPGIPLCVAQRHPHPIFVVLKSGSFGSREFLVHAARRVMHHAAIRTL
jgi:uncharacterized protein YgbK (DUF1537 family)